MSGVLFYDDRGGVSPSYLYGRQHGGSEHHQIQIFEYLAAHGVHVDVMHAGPHSLERGVRYLPCSEPIPDRAYDSLVVIGCASLPRGRTWTRVYSFQVVDPRPCAGLFEHLRDRGTMVCVSEWQADLFRSLGHTAIVIPVPIPDDWYGLEGPRSFDFGCFSSWNKGGLQTINAWHPEWGTLAVGSPYSHPEYTQENMPAGVTWLGTLQPRERWIDAMRSVGAIARICTIGETFGVVDVVARAMGISCYTLCTGDIGALREVGAQPFTDPAEWRLAIATRAPHPLGDADRFRLSRVLPQWLELLK